MNYALAKRLCLAGFPFKYSDRADTDSEKIAEFTPPTLEELLDQMPMRKKYLGTVNDAHFVLRKLVTVDGEEYLAAYEDEDTYNSVPGYEFFGTPTEAVANLWLAINKK